MLTTIGIGMGMLLVGVLIGVGASDDQWKEERDRRRRAEADLAEAVRGVVRGARFPAGTAAAVDARRPAADAHPMFRVAPGVHESLRAVRVQPRAWAVAGHREMYGEEQWGGYIDVLLEHQLGRVADAWVGGELTRGAIVARRLNEGLSGRSGVAA